LRHYYIDEDCSGDHFAVSTNAIKENQVLVQIQENGVQARISISLEKAQIMIDLLKESIKKSLNKQ
jgi:hypothetical protein